MRFRSVVLPEPRNPVSTVTGIRFVSVTTDTSRAPPRAKTPGQPMRNERGGIRKGYRQREPRVAGPFILSPHRSKPAAMYQSPTATFATSLPGRSPDSRAHLNHAGKSPSRVTTDAVAFGFTVTRLPLRGQRRVWF